MFTRIIRSNLKLSTINNVLKLPEAAIDSKCFSNNTNKNYSLEATPAASKKKTSIVPKITLLSGSDLNITTLEEAQKLAKRRDLKLVKILDIDTKTQRPVYQLMTGAEYHQEDLKQRERKKAEKQKSPFKGEKVLIVGQNISQHDLQTHCSKIVKWLGKNYEVRMVINGDAESMKKAEEVYSFLEENLSGQGRMVQKRQKGSDIRFQVLPPAQENKPSSDNKKTSGNDGII